MHKGIVFGFVLLFPKLAKDGSDATYVFACFANKLVAVFSVFSVFISVYNP